MPDILQCETSLQRDCGHAPAQQPTDCVSRTGCASVPRSPRRSTQLLDGVVCPRGSSMRTSPPVMTRPSVSPTSSLLTKGRRIQESLQESRVDSESLETRGRGHLPEKLGDCVTTIGAITESNVI